MTSKINDPQDEINVVSIGNTKKVQVIVQRFNVIVDTVEHKMDVLERPYIDILLHESELSANEISGLSLYIKTFFTKRNMSCSIKDIEYKIATYKTTISEWEGRNYVGEKSGQIFVQKTPKSVLPVSNFTLSPIYTITVQKGEKYHVYNVNVLKDPKTYRIMLLARDFNSLDSLQKRVAEQLQGSSAFINDCSKHMGDLAHRYITLAQWEYEKQGTSLIGLERLEDDGPKYFCTPDAIFGLDGKVSNDIVYMGNEQTNAEEIKNFSNLDYSLKEWQGIAKTFLSNVVHINEKIAMMSLLGWMGAIPHDYVIRKEAGVGFFPHCHIVGEPGSGKSTIMTLVKQFMGHNDSAPRTFPTPFETSKLLNSSYTIPVILDEYGKRWRPDFTDAMNKILVEAFNRPKWSRGTSSQGSIYYKYKNPILIGGQVPTSDQALATRIVPIRLYKSFQKSKAGATAEQSIRKLQRMKDKNFWVGYNLWCAKYTNEEVEQQFKVFQDISKNTIADNRVAIIYAVVMLGLHFMKQLADELGVDIGYTAEEILEMPQKLDFSASAIETKDVSPLKDFLSDLAHYSVAIGNSSIMGRYFGKGLSVMPYKPTSSGAGEYGNSSKQPACIYGRDLMLIKVEEMCKVLNKHNRNTDHNSREIMTFIESDFKKSMENPQDDNNFILAPKQYKHHKYGMYTAISATTMCDIYQEFENIKWE